MEKKLINYAISRGNTCIELYYFGYLSKLVDRLSDLGFL